MPITDEETRQLFAKLGEISGKLDMVIDDNKSQWDAINQNTDRLNKAEFRNGGIAVAVSAMVNIGIVAVKNTIKGA